MKFAQDFGILKPWTKMLRVHNFNWLSQNNMNSELQFELQICSLSFLYVDNLGHTTLSNVQP